MLSGRIDLISFKVITSIVALHFKEVLTDNDANDAHKNCRDCDEACEEEECHIFGIVAFAITDEKNHDGEEEDYEVVHDFMFCVSCCCS